MKTLLLLAGLSTVLINVRLANGEDKLRILDRPTVTVRTSCNAKGEGTGDLILRNDTNAAVLIHLSAGDLTGKPPTKHLIIPTLDAKDGSLDPKQELKVHFIVTDLHEDGDWQSMIQNDGVDVGTIRVVRTSPPFALSLDVATPDSPELTFLEGKSASFRLKNGDQQEYSIAWQYDVNGLTKRSPDPNHHESSGPKKPGWFCRLFCKGEEDKVAATGATTSTFGESLTVPPAGQKEINFYPPNHWFGSPFVGLFKDDVADGRLTVDLVDQECPGHPSTSKTFKVKTHLATSAGPRREGLADLWVFFFLALGGVFSLGLNAWLPNEMRRLKIKQQLRKLGAQISNLSYELASRLRVLVGLEARLITDRLRNLTWGSADFAGEMQGIEQSITRLSTRLQLLEGLGSTRTNFLRIRAEVLAPSAIFALEETFGKILQIGEKANPTDEDVQKAQALIKRIQDQLDLGIQGNTEFAKTLATEAAQFKAEFDATNGRIGKSATCKRIRETFPGPFTRLESVDANAIAATPPPPQDLIDLDATLFDLELIRGYVDLVEGLSASDSLGSKIAAHEGELLDYLKRRNPETIYAARLLFKQMEDGYFKDDIEAAIKAKQVRIKVDHGDIRPYDPCEFRLELSNAALNAAYARQEWTCHWAFTFGDQTLVEEGWVVTHYFQEGDTYDLKITLTHNIDACQVEVPNVEVFPEGKIHILPVNRRNFGKAVQGILHWDWAAAKKELSTRRRGRGTKALDYVRLAMTLVIALFGLLAGAKEQLLKLDVLPALVAVFMVGFGADQIKNLLTQKTPGSDTAAPH